MVSTLARGAVDSGRSYGVVSLALAILAWAMIAPVGSVDLPTSDRSAQESPAAAQGTPIPIAAAAQATRTPTRTPTPSLTATPTRTVEPTRTPAPPIQPVTAADASTLGPPAKFTVQLSTVHPDQQYYLYIPTSYDEVNPARLLVVMHGAGRRAEEYGSEFTRFADDYRYVILAPLFPKGEGYQQLGLGDSDWMRSDLRLLSLVDEIGTLYKVQTDTFDLFGFSAGAQFSHRFMYVHPERLRTVTAAAPGTIALPDTRYRWPFGLSDIHKLIDRPHDMAKIRNVPAMLIVGKDDIEDDGLNESDEALRSGRTRLKRARLLHQAWLQAGIQHRYVEFVGIGHDLDENIAGRTVRFLIAGG